MQEILFHYKKIHPMNWVYLSSLLTICVYFKFSRFWSVRNLDLVGLLLFAPGLVLVAYGNANPNPPEAMLGIGQLGYIWLFTVGGLFLVRMLMDSLMVRRPLLEPNLSVGGMTFLGIALLIFLMANIANSDPKELAPLPTEIATIIDATEEETAESDASDNTGSGEASTNKGLQQYGPRNPLLALLPEISTQTFFPDSERKTGDVNQVIYDPRRIAVAKSIAILSHLAVIIGMVLIGYHHFDNIKTGIAAAVLYLLLPYTAEMTGRVPHVLPAALLVWAIVTYRRPIFAGIFLGLAIGVIYYPLFLLPLWLSFYWKRGALRFCGGLSLALTVSVGILGIYQSNDAFLADVQQMLGIAPPKLTNLQGFWQHIDAVYRLPVIATFVALGGSFAIWPPQKNLGTLMSCSAAMMLGCQFWNAHGGGLYMAWYLPLLLLTIFRPNLEDRVASSILTPRTVRRAAP